MIGFERNRLKIADPSPAESGQDADCRLKTALISPVIA